MFLGHFRGREKRTKFCAVDLREMAATYDRRVADSSSRLEIQADQTIECGKRPMIYQPK
jgi:hypothetical protein